MKGFQNGLATYWRVVFAATAMPAFEAASRAACERLLAAAAKHL